MKLWYFIAILVIIQKSTVDSASLSIQTPEEGSGSGDGEYDDDEDYNGNKDEITIDDEDYDGTIKPCGGPNCGGEISKNITNRFSEDNHYGNKDIVTIDDEDHNSTPSFQTLEDGSGSGDYGSGSDDDGYDDDEDYYGNHGNHDGTIKPCGTSNCGGEMSKNITSRFGEETFNEYIIEIDIKNTTEHTIISNVDKIGFSGRNPVHLSMFSRWRKLPIEKSELNIDIIKLIQNSNRKCTVYTSVDSVNFVIYC
ncbi:uncharacterized protein LOC114328076 [Diabrotica virgifera virgifera]|uniref:Protein transport protein SEC7-like n=1 Tax=Diabrotica virgifera virgifera TaxID=50390 RepID=A0A6P7FHE5_DIAVI|nr:uncharacterized protein LOC114328076 [Diabrotica virgifera virgifera]